MLSFRPDRDHTHSTKPLAAAAMTIAAHPDPSVRIRWACRRLAAAGPVPARPSPGYPDDGHQRRLPSRHVRAPAATGPPWSQMWSHSPAFIGVWRGPPERQSARHGRSRPAANAGMHTWKACWGQPLASSNLASSATSDQAIHQAGHAFGLGLQGCVVSFVVSFILRISV